MRRGDWSAQGLRRRRPPVRPPTPEGLTFHRRAYHAGMFDGTEWTAVWLGTEVGRWEATGTVCWVETPDGRVRHIFKRDWREACCAEVRRRRVR